MRPAARSWIVRRYSPARPPSRRRNRSPNHCPADQELSMRLLPAFLAATFLVGTALAWAQPSPKLADAVAARHKPKFGSFGLDLSAMDKSVKPGDNFFQYVNGGYLKTAVIPADRTQTGSYQDLQILSEQRMRAIVDVLEKKPYAELSAEEKKLRDLYDAFEDTGAIE